MIANDTNFDTYDDYTNISNSQVTLQIRGSVTEGIYIEVSSKIKNETTGTID